MPLSTLGQIKTSPLPQTVQADQTSQDPWTTKDERGIEYSGKQLMDDITENILASRAAVDITDPNYGQAASDLNNFIQNLATTLTSDASFKSDRQNWMFKWHAAFEKNPTVNLSNKIKTFISGLFDKSNPDYVGGITKVFYFEGSARFASEVASKITQFMNTLPDSVSKMTIDKDAMKSGMGSELTSVLSKFNLELSDENSKIDEVRNGVSKFFNLKDQAVNSLSQIFESVDTKEHGRPYRDFDQASAKARVIREFETLYHTQEWVNTLAASAFAKAKADLQEILDRIDVSTFKLDTRTLKVIEEFKKWAHDNGTKTNPIKTPPLLLEKLLGKTAGDDFKKWFDKWKDIVQSSHEESDISSQGETVVTFDMSLISGKEIFPAGIYNANPISIDTDLMRKSGMTIPTGEDKTKGIPVSSITYSTDHLKEAYLKLISFVTKSSSINEDDYEKLLKSKGWTKGLEDDFHKENLSLDDIEMLNPEIFTKDKNGKSSFQESIDKTIDFIKNTGDKWLTQLGVTFAIKYETEDNGEKRIIITPTFKDPLIANLPGLDWSGSSFVDAPQSSRDIIDNLFKGLDKEHIELTTPKIPSISQRLVSPLEAKAAETYGKFNAAQQDKALPYKVDFNGDLDNDGDVPLSFIERVFPGVATFLKQFEDGDSKRRYKIQFTHTAIEDSRIKVSYSIEDLTNGEETDVTNSVDKVPLDNIVIVFNENADKGQDILEELDKSKKGEVEEFGKVDEVKKMIQKLPGFTIPDGQFNTYFQEFGKIVAEAAAEGVTLTKGKVTQDPETKVLLQNFIAEYTTPGSKVVHHEKAIQFTHEFLSPDERDKAKDDIDKNAAEAKKTLQESTMDQDKKDELTDQVDKTSDFLKDQIDHHGDDMSKQRLKAIEELSNKMPTAATAAVMSEKYNEVHGMLEKQFPKGIPKDVEDLFTKHWQDFEDIIKSDPSILHHPDQLAKLLKNLNAKNLMNVKRSMQLSGKIALLSLGGLLGMGGIVGGANAVKVATTNKKAVNAKTGKIKSSKKLAAISALIGLASIAGSIGTMVYLFVSQGGL